MQCAYKCTVLKLLNKSVISPWGKIIDLIQAFSQLAGVYWTFQVSMGLVWYLQKNWIPKFGALNSRCAKWGSIKSGHTLAIYDVLINTLGIIRMPTLILDMLL
jgi:hypothetical protein